MEQVETKSHLTSQQPSQIRPNSELPPRVPATAQAKPQYKYVNPRRHSRNKNRKKCVVCGRRKTLGSFLAKIPTACVVRCYNWVKRIGMTDLLHIPIEKLHLRYVCGRHFEPSAFRSGIRGVGKLFEEVYPTLEMPYPPLTDKQMRDFPLHCYETTRHDKASTMMSVVATKRPSNLEGIRSIPSSFDHDYCPNLNQSKKSSDPPVTKVVDLDTSDIPLTTDKKDENEVTPNKDIKKRMYKMVSTNGKKQAENEVTPNTDIKKRMYKMVTIDGKVVFEEYEKVAHRPTSGRERSDVVNCGSYEEDKENNTILNEGLAVDDDLTTDDFLIDDDVPLAEEGVPLIYDKISPNKIYKMVTVDGKLVLKEHEKFGCLLAQEKENCSIDDKENNIKDSRNDIPGTEPQQKLNKQKQNKVMPGVQMISSRLRLYSKQLTKNLTIRLYKIMLQLQAEFRREGQEQTGDRVEVEVLPEPTKMPSMLSIINTLGHISNSLSLRLRREQREKNVLAERLYKVVLKLQAKVLRERGNMEAPLPESTKIPALSSVINMLEDITSNRITQKFMNLQNKLPVRDESISKPGNNVSVEEGQLFVELLELRHLKAQLCKNYSSAQILTMLSPTSRQLVEWSEEDLKNAAYLKDIVSPQAFKFLRQQLLVPLPRDVILNNYINEKNKLNSSRHDTQEVTHCGNNNDTRNVNVETAQDIQTRDVDTENARAVNSIIDKEPTPQSTELPEISEQNKIAYEPAHEHSNINFSYNAHDVSNIQDNSAHDESNIQDDYNALDDGSIQDNGAHDSNIQEDCNTHYNNNVPVDNNLPSDSVPVQENVRHFSIEDLSKRHRFVRFKCELCQRPFETKEELRGHVPAHYFNSFYTNYLDVKRDKTTKSYHCDFCREPLHLKSAVVRHHRMHLGIIEMKCWYPGCIYIGKNRDALSHHMTSHRDRTLACPVCSKQFTKLHGLREHIARLHADRTTRTCALCGGRYRNEFTYRKHMRSHDRPPRFKCPEAGCGEAFYSRVALGRHKLRHKGLDGDDSHPYKCPVCPLASYSHPALFNRHMARHKDNKLRNCSSCRLVFHDYGEFYAHYVTTHVRRHSCVCSAYFNSNKKLKDHKLNCEQAKAVNDVPEDDQPKTRKKRKKKEDKIEEDSNVTPKKQKVEYAVPEPKTKYLVYPPPHYKPVIISEDRTKTTPVVINQPTNLQGNSPKERTVVLENKVVLNQQSQRRHVIEIRKKDGTLRNGSQKHAKVAQPDMPFIDLSDDCGPCVEQNVEHIEQNVQHVEQGGQYVQQSVQHVQQGVQHVQQSVQHVQQGVQHVQQVVQHDQQGVQHVAQNVQHVAQNVQQVTQNVRYVIKKVQGVDQNVQYVVHKYVK